MRGEGYNRAMPSLSPARRSALRALAHALKPVVIIGDAGLTDAVVAEVERALRAHELVKVKAAGGDREQRSQWMVALCERTFAYPVQEIGKMLVLWREAPKKEAAEPAAKPRKPAVKAKPVARSRKATPPPEPAPRTRRTAARPASESRSRRTVARAEPAPRGGRTPPSPAETRRRRPRGR